MAARGIRAYPNNVSTRLTAQLLVAGVSCTVTAGDGALFAAAATPDFIMATLRRMSGYKDVAREIVKVTARSTDTLTITRAQESTTALQFEVGDQLDIDFTQRTFTTDIQVVGTTTNDDAPAGYVGEIITGDVPAGSAVALTTAVAANMTSISLTAGHWRVHLAIYFTPAATTTITYLIGSISSTSATVDAAPGAFGELALANIVPAANYLSVHPTYFKKLSGPGSAAVYGVALCVFGVSTLSTWGKLWAERVR